MKFLYISYRQISKKTLIKKALRLYLWDAYFFEGIKAGNYLE